MRTPSKIQKEAIQHLLGPAQVVAGPGSGKTYVIIQRILYLLDHCQISPDQILVITYTKSAAQEMQRRFEAECKDTQNLGVNFGTLHGVCYRILMDTGFCKKDSLITEAQKRELFKVLLGNMGLAECTGYDMVTALLHEVSRMKNLDPNAEMRFLRSSPPGLNEDQVKALVQEYQRYLEEQGWIDFDDMIIKCLKLFREQPALQTRYQQRFTHILADEFQDINAPQYELLKLLAMPQNNLFVVGDDDQAIYGFRGASPGIMRRFAQDYGSCRQILMTENYRSGQKIVKAAEEVITKNQERFPKSFFPIREGGNIWLSCFDTRKEEAESMLRLLNSMKDEERNSTAIILRTNLETVHYHELLKREHIAVKGQKMEPHRDELSFITEDISAYLSYLYHGRKRKDLLCFLNKPMRYFSREAVAFEGDLRAQALNYYRNNPEMKRRVEDFFDKLLLASEMHPSVAVRFFLHVLGYEKYLKQKAGSPEEEKRYERQVAEATLALKEGLPDENIASFLEHAVSKKNRDKKEPYGVEVLTMHGAKGLEFDQVFLPDLNEGVIPGKRICDRQQLEEERRLLYVAITRARNKLYLSYTKERGRKRSRYLEGISYLPSLP